MCTTQLICCSASHDPEHESAAAAAEGSIPDTAMRGAFVGGRAPYRRCGRGGGAGRPVRAPARMDGTARGWLACWSARSPCTTAPQASAARFLTSAARSPTLERAAVAASERQGTAYCGRRSCLRTPVKPGVTHADAASRVTPTHRDGTKSHEFAAAALVSRCIATHTTRARQGCWPVLTASHLCAILEV